MELIKKLDFIADCKQLLHILGFEDKWERFRFDLFWPNKNAHKKLFL
jgi:hypothetical protein